MVRRIAVAVRRASRAWIHVADTFELLLKSVDPNKAGDEFEQSILCFWIIKTIEKIEPMITDNLEHLDWYTKKNHLSDTTDEWLYNRQENGVHVPPALNEWNEGNEWHNWRQILNRSLARMEVAKIKIRKSQERFQLLRSHAQSSRDGVTNT